VESLDKNTRRAEYAFKFRSALIAGAWIAFRIQRGKANGMRPPGLGDQSATSCHRAPRSQVRAGWPAMAIWILGVSDGGPSASETVHAHPQVDIPAASPPISQGDRAGGAPCPAGAQPGTGDDMVEEDA
jgi:hypothetical protein